MLHAVNNDAPEPQDSDEETAREISEFIEERVERFSDPELHGAAVRAAVQWKAAAKVRLLRGVH